MPDAIYFGNIKFSDLVHQNLIEIETRGFKNEIYILYNPSFIKNYDQANLEEIQNFERVIRNPRFCHAHRDFGIKQLVRNIPKCEVTINNQKENSHIKFEIKIIGTGMVGRIGLIELKPIHGEGPTILVASNYEKKGFHTSSKINQTYHFDMMIRNQSHAKNHMSFFKNHRKDRVAESNEQVDSPSFTS